MESKKYENDAKTYKPVLFQKMILKVPWFFFVQNSAWVLTNFTNTERINICN